MVAKTRYFFVLLALMFDEADWFTHTCTWWCV